MAPDTRIALFGLAMAVGFGLGIVGALALLLDRLGRRRIARWERRGARVGIGVTALGLACLAWGYGIEPRWLEITFHELQTPKLAAGTRLRIVQLADLHARPGSIDPRGLAARVNALHPDLVIFTGDAINAEGGLPLFREALSALRAPLGVYAVRGNHDVLYWRDVDLFAGIAQDLGEGGAEPVPGVALCGSPFGKGAPLLKCLRETRGKFQIAVHHMPHVVEELPDAPDLYLAGHTHGGQVRLPFYGALVTLSPLDKKYEAGMYQVGPTTLYVSRGIGLERDAPRVRFLCRPEIAVFDVVGIGPAAP